MLDEKKAVDDFIAYIKVEKGLAENTALAYKSDLLKFIDYAQNKKIDISVISHQDITDFLWGQKQEGLSPSSIYRTIESIRQFYKFLHNENIIKTNPAKDVPVPRLMEKLPTVLSVGETDALLNSVSENNITSIRNRAMFEILYATGMRISELINLKFEDLNMNDRFLKVFGKGSKERLVPFGETAKRFLIIYLNARKKIKDAKEFIFISRLEKKISRVAVWQQLSAAARNAGIEKKIYPHILRHSCASHLLAGGADIRFVQEILGHSSISSTQLYTHLDAREIGEKHKKFHPRG
ncbi:MAG: site-specific tyrosine recombinase XerD [Elusimicrobiota bacterium]|jgi:integrase/recombinase XerD|nr:site-specific tyrosine recombinase XerD [Elusimicrobiota bacterium]